MQTQTASATSSSSSLPVVVPSRLVSTYGSPCAGEVAVGEGRGGHQRGDDQEAHHRCRRQRPRGGSSAAWWRGACASPPRVRPHCRSRPGRRRPSTPRSAAVRRTRCSCRGSWCAARRTARARRWPNSRMTIRTTPMSSQVTPTEFTIAVIRTLVALSTVVATSSRQPSSTALAAPSREASDGSVPTSWNPLQTAGSTTCKAIAAAASGDDLGDHHRPAREPADHRAAEPSGPLIDRAGEWDSARPVRRSTARPSAARPGRPARSRRTPCRRSRIPARRAGRRWSGSRRTRSRRRRKRRCRRGGRVAGCIRSRPRSAALAPSTAGWSSVAGIPASAEWGPERARHGRAIKASRAFVPPWSGARRAAPPPLSDQTCRRGSGTLGAPRLRQRVGTSSEARCFSNRRLW